MKSPAFVAGCAALMLVLSAAPAPAAIGSFGSPQGFSPRVPISALARPMSWLEPSRLRVSSATSFGAFSGGVASALQTTSFSYQFDAPVWMSVQLGNAWGAGAQGANGSLFLQGVNFAFKPSTSTFFEFRYQSFRSPLQGMAGPRDFWAP
jgi:hypothetical protein